MCQVIRAKQWSTREFAVIVVLLGNFEILKPELFKFFWLFKDVPLTRIMCVFFTDLY